MGFYSPDLLAFAWTLKIQSSDMPRRASTPSSTSINKDAHRRHVAAAVYLAHHLVSDVAAWFSKVSTDPFQVQYLPGVLSKASIASQGALVAWTPLLLESSEWAILSRMVLKRDLKVF